MNQPPDSTIFNFAIFNGELLPIDQAKISIFNQAFFSSFGVYETVKVDQGRPFFLEEHLHRLQNSAEQLDLELNVDRRTLAEWVGKLRAVDPQATWSLKIIVLGTTEPEDLPIIAMQPVPLPTYPAKMYRSGAAAILFEGQRVMPACKSLNTLVNYLARYRARQAGALEGLLHHNGYLTEGARSNLFAVQKGVILTPPTAEVLSGITRDVIFQVMARSPHPVIEAQLPTDLSLYEEVFISSTSMHVMPITTIDNRPVGNGRVGPITQIVMDRFNQFYAEYMRSAELEF